MWTLRSRSSSSTLESPSSRVMLLPQRRLSGAP
jgi:hypothetical protein